MFNAQTIRIRSGAVHQFTQLYIDTNASRKKKNYGRIIREYLAQSSAFFRKKTAGTDIFLCCFEEYMFVVNTTNPTTLVEVKRKGIVYCEKSIDALIEKHRKQKRKKFTDVIDIKTVVPTDHALKRFIQRFHPGISMDEAYDLSKKVLLQTEQMWLDPVTNVKRMINNRFQEVYYFFYEDYRFIISNEEGFHYIITVEQNCP